MTVTIKLFAILRDKAGKSEVQLQLPDSATIATAAETLATKFPTLLNHLPRVAYALNREYAAKDVLLHDGDELALIPPVSGGAT
jgi:molybdopterin converting factor subunit 1